VKVGLIAVFLLPVLLGLPLPFSPVQIILLELFMDFGASAGFVAEPAEEDIYRRPPRRPQAGLLGAPTIRDILVKGLLLFAAVMAAYAYARGQGLSAAAVQSCAFSAWMAGHVVLAFISRSGRECILRRGVFTNRAMNAWAAAALGFLLAAVYLQPLRVALRFAAVSPVHLGIAAVLAALVAASAELRKLLPQSPGRPRSSHVVQS
jgi:Ca2+-transporting ATPase